MNKRVDGDVGQIVRLAGPVVGTVGLSNARLNEVVRVGRLGLMGEVIRLSGDITTVQVYEDTSGVSIGEPVESTGNPLTAWLGPGLLGQIYDGCQRPLMELERLTGNFIERGVSLPELPQTKLWTFNPCLSVGDSVEPGDVLGSVAETPAIEHRVMVPPGVCGRLVALDKGDYTVQEDVAVINIAGGDGSQNAQRCIKLANPWPVRQPRPVQHKLEFREPLITGTRVIDALFPVAKGGTAIIPGGFGTGKTVLEQSLARWADADVVVYVGCGERGNEMAEVLEEFPRLNDPRTGLPLMDRTVLIANTSNMPVAAREASIYTGITIAEYYRDMGYDVLLLADSTSRWGEALREISGRLEEIPGEEGYPAYLSTRLSQFYERSGRVACLGHHNDGPEFRHRIGSLTIVGAVSPPGGDFSEPITQSSLRTTGAFWALDYSLSRRRHFPAISWTQSYTLYQFSSWYAGNLADDWAGLVRDSAELLQRADELQEIVQLVGREALSEAERLLLLIAQMIQEDFLQQSTLEEFDRYCPLTKCYWMLKALMTFNTYSQAALQVGVALEQIQNLPEISTLAALKEIMPDAAASAIEDVCRQMRSTFAEFGVA